MFLSTITISPTLVLVCYSCCYSHYCTHLTQIRRKKVTIFLLDYNQTTSSSKVSLVPFGGLYLVPFGGLYLVHITLQAGWSYANSSWWSTPVRGLKPAFILMSRIFYHCDTCIYSPTQKQSVMHFLTTISKKLKYFHEFSQLESYVQPANTTDITTTLCCINVLLCKMRPGCWPHSPWQLTTSNWIQNTFMNNLLLNTTFSQF